MAAQQPYDGLATVANPLAALTGAPPDLAWLLADLTLAGVDFRLEIAQFKGVRRVPPGSALVFRDHAVPDVVRLSAGPRATFGEGAWRLRDVLTTVVTRRALAAERVTTDLSGGVGSGSVTCLAVARKPVLAVTYTDARMAGDDHRPPAMGRPDSRAVPGYCGRRRLPGDPALRAGPAGGLQAARADRAGPPGARLAADPADEDAVHHKRVRRAGRQRPREWLDHNELGLAFDDLVDLGHDHELPLAFWQHLDEAAREMNLYSSVLDKPHLTSADLCRRHIAAASESDDTHVE
ncbi:MafI family immunity protein [Streptomyces sp. SRF1]|nr:MafI family immunity protein [Streptomyces sp. SRF1]MDN3057031.1 MafI family immunity protein [Streptomyces sp. SRF1]